MTVQRDKKYKIKKKNSRQRCSGLFHAGKANKSCFLLLFFLPLVFLGNRNTTQSFQSVSHLCMSQKTHGAKCKACLLANCLEEQIKYFYFFLLLARSVVQGDSERCGLVLLAAAWCSVQMDSQGFLHLINLAGCIFFSCCRQGHS